MSGLGLLLEGFDAGKHPRDFRGRWARVTLKAITPGPQHSEAYSVVRDGKVTREQILRRRDTGEYRHSLGAPGVTTAKLGAEDVRALGLGGAAAAASPDRHGGFKVGDQVSYRTPSIVNGKVEGYGPPQSGSVHGLQRNGYVRVREPRHGTTVDVHHKNLTRAPAGRVNMLDPRVSAADQEAQIARDKAKLDAERHARAAALGRPIPRMMEHPEIKRTGEAYAQAERQAAATRDRKLADARAAYEDRKLRVPSKSVAFREYKQVEQRIRAEYNAAVQATADAYREARIKHPRTVPVQEGVLGALLEGFAPSVVGPPASWAGRFDVKDNVAVPVKGGTVIGRVLRASGARPDTHVIIDPGGGEAHVEAEVSKVRLHTPETYASAAQQAAAAQAAQGGPPGAGGQGGGAGAVREGVGLLLEGFAPPAPRETPAQSQARGAKQVVAAQKSLASGWNASKHPRAAGGKFGYTTGGKRAKRSSSASSRTLGVGSNGALVRSIQRQLHIPADGKYGPQTRAAVERYQRQHGLQVDGVVGAQTIAGLRGNPNAKSIAPGPITSRVARVHPASRTTRSARGRTVTTTTVTTSAARVPARASAKARARSRYGGGAIV